MCRCVESTVRSGPVIRSLKDLREKFPTLLVALQRQRSLTSSAHHRDHTDLPHCKLATFLLVLLRLLDEQRCVSAWSRDHLDRAKTNFYILTYIINSDFRILGSLRPNEIPLVCGPHSP